MTDHIIDKESSTIYQFTLLRRIRHGFWFRHLPQLSIIATIPIAYLQLGIDGVIRFLLLCGIFHISYMTTTWLWQLSYPASERQELCIRWYFPWIGMSYKHTMNIQSYLHHIILLWVIPAACTAAASPWIPTKWVFMSAIVHLQFLWPRTTIIFLLLATRKSGIIRVEKDNTSLYSP